MALNKVAFNQNKKDQDMGCFYTESREERKMEESSSFRKRSAGMAKEYRSRFYILRRCVAMLLCWHKYAK